MTSIRWAALDVGTNSVKLLVADVSEGGLLSKVRHAVALTRLGEGLSATGRITDEAARRTIEQVRAFQQEATALGAHGFVTLGMQAFRQARNGPEVKALLEGRTGLPLRVLQGAEEARLGLQGVLVDFPIDKGPYAMIDIGGGSTEMVWTAGPEVTERSLPEGAVTSTEQFVRADPPTRTEMEALRQAMEERLLPALREVQQASGIPSAQLIGVGGTVTTTAAILARLEVYDSSKIHLGHFSRDQLATSLQELSALPLSKRRLIPGLTPARADIILGGQTILLALMTGLDFDTCTVSESGLLHAALREAALEAMASSP